MYYVFYENCYNYILVQLYYILFLYSSKLLTKRFIYCILSVSVAEWVRVFSMLNGSEVEDKQYTQHDKLILQPYHMPQATCDTVVEGGNFI